MLRIVPFRPGVIKDDPTYTAQGYASDSDKVMWVRGFAQSMPGWEMASADTIQGKARGIVTWAVLNGTPYYGVGTSTRLQVGTGSQVFNITPSRSTGSFGANPFATTSGSAVVAVTHSGHGAVNNDTVQIAGGTAVAGITLGGAAGTFPSNPFTTVSGSQIVVVTHSGHGMFTGDGNTIAGGSAVAGLTMSGTYLIYVLNTNAYLIDAGTAANASTSGGGTPTYAYARTYQLTYVDANTYTVVAPVAANTTTSGGGTPTFLYEINSGNADGLGGYGYGTGAYGTGPYGVASPGATFNARTWSLAHFGQNLLANVFAGPIYTWAPDVSARATVLTNSPAQCNAIIVTPERFVMALGCTNTGGIYDPMLIRYCDQTNTTTWTPANGNLAGSLTLSEGSMIVGAKNSKGGTLVWTDTAVYLITYTANIDALYQATLIGTGCGALGPNAVIDRDGLAFWISPGFQFFVYAGGTPRPLPNPNRTYFANRVMAGQSYKVFTYFDAKYSAVGWLYPGASIECDSYMRLDILEAANDPKAGWSVGAIDRTCWIDRDVFSHPLAVSSGGTVYVHDQGNGDNGNPLTRYVTWAPIQLPDPNSDGQHLMQVRRIQADTAILSGALTFQGSAQRWPNGPITTKPAVSLTSATQYNDLRFVGRQFGGIFKSIGASDNWRLGNIRLDMSMGPLR